MNKKVKFLSSTLSALLLTSGIALTNVHAQSTNNATAPNSLITTDSNYTINGSNKGYNYDVYTDVYDNIHVSISPDDYESHTYKVNVRFYDKNNKQVSQITDSKFSLTYTHVFNYGGNWVKASVWIYADGDYIDTVDVNI
ncbi:hypothetical protein [Clostridium kluyveri]|uniref:hypothetical protein n=1 Tax=Clostridium kluyveri TaxID=1534 RepID=UPI0022487356|nr:hypothetical protein [Clostridium kluyveri]UZQ49564.1 hypothetical protein OP486_16655 [Clostridium kluyveri]